MDPVSLGKLLEERLMTALEKFISSGSVIWTEIELRTKEFWVFKHPTIDNSFIFAPVDAKNNLLYSTYQGCYLHGYLGYETKKWSDFKIIQNFGDNCKIQYPYFELITNKYFDS